MAEAQHSPIDQAPQTQEQLQGDQAPAPEEALLGSGHMTVDTFGKPDLPTFLAWK